MNKKSDILKTFLYWTLILLVGITAVQLMTIMLIQTQNLSGWFLFCLILFLASYRFRKSFAFLPIGNVSGWLQLHIFAGLGSGILFFYHTGIRIPGGMFEIVLYACYLLVFTSGIAGFLMTRLIPSRLTARGEEVIFERIPIYLSDIREQAELLVFESVDEGKATVLSDYYLANLHDYFSRPANRLAHLFHSERHKQTMLHQISELERFLSGSEKEITEKLVNQIHQKEDIDYQYSLQLALKTWLFIHVPLTWILILLAFFHAILASAFSSVII